MFLSNEVLIKIMYWHYLSIVLFFKKDDVTIYLQPRSYSFIKHTFVKHLLWVLQISGMEIYNSEKKKQKSPPLNEFTF